MAEKKETAADSAPTARTCETDRVHERLLRTDPGYASRRAACEDQAWRAEQSRLTGRTGCTLIPVVVHVVHRTNAENISTAQIESQIDVLNEDFRKKNGDISTVPAAFAPLVADARIQFELASADPDGAPTDGITRTRTNVNGFSSNDDIKRSADGGMDAWPSDRYLNLWVGRLAGGLLGYAQFPGGPAETDGVVVTHTGFGTTGTAAAPFNLGRTTTHEIGHWLNLRHIWGDDGSGCSGSDFVSDTPNQGGANVGKPTFPNISCSNGPNGDMYMNYMDYVDDDTMTMFSEGQVRRMQATLDGFRSSIGSSIPCGIISTLKFVDDPQTFKFSDDPQTLKFVDDPQTLKFSDDPQTLKFFDDPQTVKFADDPQSFKFSDDPQTVKFADDPQSLKFSDDIGTNPNIDQVKQPGLDKHPAADVIGPGGHGRPDGFRGQGGQGGGPAPFVLATPHHSNAWSQSYPGAHDAAMEQYRQRLVEYEQVLADYGSAEQAGQLQDADRAEAERLYQEYERMANEYQQMGGSQ